MNKRTFVGVMVVALGLVIMAGGLLASNMGFKLNYQLLQQGAGSNSGTHSIALPDYPQTGLATANNLKTDIGTAQCANVQRYLKASDTIQVYSATKGQVDWALTAGEGNLVKMNTTVNYIIVGADNPTAQTPLLQADGGVNSGSGTTLYAYNYHATAATANALKSDIGAAQCANVQRYLTASDTIQVYSGTKGQVDWGLVPGQAYFVKMNTTVNYAPSHY